MKTFEKIHNFKIWKKWSDWFAENSFKRWLLIVSLFACGSAFLLIIVSRYLDLSFARVSVSNFRLNTVAPEDFIVTRDIYYNNEKATEERRNVKADQVLPVYKFNKNILAESLKDFELFTSTFTKDLKVSFSPDRIVSELNVSLPAVKDYIGKNEVAALISLAGWNDTIFSSAKRLINQVMNEGIFDRIEEVSAKNPELFKQGRIEIWKDDYDKEERSLDKVIDKNNLQDWIVDRTKTIPLNEVGKSLVILFVKAFSRENCFLDTDQTEENRKKARDEVQPKIEHLVKGTIIVEKGKIVTEEALEKIRAHEESDISLNINNVVSTILILITLYAITLFLFYRHVSGVRLKKNQILLLFGIAFFYLIAIIISSKLWKGPEWLPFAIFLPTSSIAILISILISTNIGVIFTLVISLFHLFITQMNIYSFIFAFFSGIAGCAVAMRTEKRMDLINDGIILAFFNSFLILLMVYLSGVNAERHILEICYGAINGFFCGIFSLGFLPIFEHALNSATRFRLLELSDITAPILKKMLTIAPGTYNHSMVMAHLAESACMEIGANALLARVASYYHDIGKIDQPLYFIENQRSANVHDELKPNLSATIIKAHVKIGIEKAKELKLPKEVIDIIAQHHGRGIIKYFYQRAIDANKALKVSADDFKYPGDRPKSKEAAVVMLADIVEAASRTLKRPTIGKLEKLIWKIIMEKFTGGELNECNLTLTDLETIKKSFLQILTGHFHSRIEYPEIKENVT
jgi:putative nucleotidyltransferase with HDIG domain